MVMLYYSDPRYKYRWEVDENGNKRIMKNPDGKEVYLTFDTRRKVLDALKYGKQLDKGCWNTDFKFSIKERIKGLRVKVQEAKSRGQVQESEADAIPFSLLECMCQYAIQTGTALMWAMSLLQWNCMSRSQNIDNLKFSNFSIAFDAIVIRFDQTKMDKTGQKTTPKHCYANPFNFPVCLFTALGVYLMYINDKWKEGKSFLFINNGSKQGSASGMYCDSIMTWAKLEKSKIMQFIRADHVNAHGIRKGSATEATANTAETSTASIFNRGEWSLGVVLDIYWKFAQRGDQLLGRVLAGLDPNSPDFDVLPPHFTVGLDDPNIDRALKAFFGNILKYEGTNESGFIRALLGRCLASVIFHEEKIQRIIALCPGHQWSNLNIFNDDVMLKTLKNLVTINSTNGFCDKATGLASNTNLIKAIHEMINEFNKDREERISLVEKFDSMMTEIKDSVKQAYEEKALENGQLTHKNVIKIIDSRQEQSRIHHQTMLDVAVDKISNLIATNSTQNIMQQDNDSHQIKFKPRLSKLLLAFNTFLVSTNSLLGNPSLWMTSYDLGSK